MKAGPFPSNPNLRRFAREKCIPLSSSMCFSLVWVVLVAASTPQKIAPKASPSSAATGGSGGTERIQNHVVCQTSNITNILRVPSTVDADDINDELISGFCEERDSGGGGDEVEGVYQSTQVYTSPTVQTPTPHARSRRQKVKKSHLKSEGASLLKAVTTLASRTTHGVCRAVNVTGTAASVVTGGVFKLAGAAVLDAVDGLEYASSKSPTEVPGITEAYRFLAKGLRTTGEVMYDFGVAAENMTAEATEAAEETIRSVLDSVIETASGAYVGEGSSSNGSPSGYFAKEEDRVIDDMMFGTSYPGVGERGSGEDAGDDVMGYVEGGHSMDSEWATGGQRGSTEPKRDRKEQKGNGMVETKATALAARVREAIRRSILRSSRAVPSMRFPQMLACGLVFTVRGLTSNPWFGAASFVGARVYLKFVESIYLECLKERMMSDIKFEAVASWEGMTITWGDSHHHTLILRHAPTRLHEGSPERARWFNTAVSAMWVPMLEPLLARWTSRQIARGIERSLPSNVSWVGLGKVTLGPRPPTIRYIQVQNVTSLAARKNMGQESNSVIDSVLLEAGQPGGNVKAEHVVYLELGVDWTSYRSKVSLRLGEQSRRRRNWWSVTSYVPSYRVKLCDLGIKAKVIVAMAVGEGRPFVKRLWVGFAEPPLTHLSLEALTGMDIANLPVLRNHLRHVVMRCLTPLTEPRHLVIQLMPPANPPSAYRGVALAARVRPAAAGVRRGVFSRVPAFGLRRLLRNRSRTAATLAVASPSAPAATSSTTKDALAEGGGEEDLPRKGDLEDATRMLLVDVGGECRGKTVMAAAAAMRGGDPWPLSAGGLSPLTSLDRDSRQLAEGLKDQSGDQRYTAEQEDRSMMDGNGRKSEQLYPRVEAPVAEKSCCDDVGSLTEGGEEFAAADTPEEAAAPILSEEILTCDKAAVAVVEAEAYKHSRDRRGEETQRRRAVVKRRHAALRANRDALSPGRRGGAFASLGRYRSCLRLTHLRHPWRSRRRKQQRTLFGKEDPELEDIIRRVCLLSRPPQREI